MQDKPIQIKNRSTASGKTREHSRYRLEQRTPAPRKDVKQLPRGALVWPSDTATAPMRVRLGRNPTVTCRRETPSRDLSAAGELRVSHSGGRTKADRHHPGVRGQGLGPPAPSPTASPTPRLPVLPWNGPQPPAPSPQPGRNTLS